MRPGAPGRLRARVLPVRRSEALWLAACAVVMLALAVATALRSAVLVSTLGIVVVVAGLVLRPALVGIVAATAVGLAVVLVLTGAVPDDGWLRLANVVVGSALGLAASVSRAVRVRQIERLQRRDAALLAGLPHAVVGLDVDGAVVSANPAAGDLLDLDAPGPHPDLQGLAARPGGGAEELVLPGGRVVHLDWTSVRLHADDAADAAVVLVLDDAAPRLAALAQAAQLAEARREAALQRHYLDVLERALRPPLPRVPGLELACTYISADEGAPAGGDLHDAVVLADGRLYLLVLDALGHGVATTHDALRLVHSARLLVTGGTGIGELAARLDAAAGPPVMATLVTALLDPATGLFEVAAAGHPPPLLLRRDGSSTWLDSTGRGTGYPQAGTDRVAAGRLAPGDTLLLYTDGLVEAHRDIVDGLDRLPGVVRALRRRPVPVLAEQTAATMLRGAVRRDDTLVVAVRRC